MAAAVAERCKRVKIAMLGQLLPLNNPVRCAEELGMLDNLTNGRLIIGFLRGTPNEDQTYGVNPAEGRGRLFEGMDLILKALTEPQPFSWEGRYHQFRTVSGLASACATAFASGDRGDSERRHGEYAADHGLGLGVSFVPVEQMGAVTDKYFQWCADAGLAAGARPSGSSGPASTWPRPTSRAEDWLAKRTGTGPVPGGIAMPSSVSRGISAARSGEEFDLRNVLAGSPQGDVVGVSRGLNFMGGPDTVCGTDQTIPRPLRRGCDGPILSTTGRRPSGSYAGD